MPKSSGDAGPSSQQQPGGGSQRGRRLGGFEIIERIGQGGMGAVFKARQVSMDRLVALKILPRRLAQNEDFVQRFLREARSAAKLRHPNIVQAYDVGFADGYYFFAMEFVDGETLSQIVARQGPLEQNRALDIMKQTCSALVAAHKAGIVHRDIKPSNIMIDNNGEVRVTDFGLAKRTEGDVNVTADGRVLGTPAYLAPEMAKGAEADARSDLYSLGATIFYALSGRPPFEGNNFSEVLIKQATEPAPPLAAVAPSVDRRLCYIVDHLLRKNPEARYPSAEALLDDLQNLGSLHPVAAASPEAPTLEIAKKRPAARKADLRARRRQTSYVPLLAVSAIAAVVVAIGLAVATRKRPGPPATRQAVRQPQSPRTEVDPKTSTAQAGEKERIAKVMREEALAKARRQAENLMRQAEAAAAAGDFAKARAAVQAAQALDVPDLAETLKAKLDEIASREQSAAAQAKWEEAKAAASKLAAAGKFDEAAKLLAQARSLPLDGIGQLVAQELESIEAKRSAILSAYKAQSDKVWALFKERKYPEAEKLLAAIVGGASLPRVPPRAGDGPPKIQHMLEADLEAAKLLKEFWAAVERGLAARKGTVSVEGALGNIASVQNGIITIKTPKGPVTRKVQQLDTRAALHYATFGKKNDERSHLAEAIFRIAEAHKLGPADLERAEKLLAASGNPPGLAFYNARLDILTLGAAEVAARRAWAKIEAAAKPKPTKAEAQRLLALLDAFERTYANTKQFAAVRDKLAALRALTQPAPKEPGWVSLFDGKTLKGWQAVNEGPFARHGAIGAKEGQLILGAGQALTGVRWTADFPTTDYEVVLEASRVSGNDGFCNITFPIGSSLCTFSVGGWGGAIVALHIVDGRNGDANVTTRKMSFQRGRWYRIRLRVTGTRIEGWIDDEQVMGIDRAGHAFSVSACQLLRPFGLHSSSRTAAGLRNIRLRRLGSKAEKGAEDVNAGKWKSLFDGKTLKGWRVVEGGEFTGHGEVRVDGGEILLGRGRPHTAISWSGPFPAIEYEVEVEVRRVAGPEFCTVTFPVGAAFCGLNIGGWGAKVLGLSLVDGRKAIENETKKAVNFQLGRWYRVRLRVTESDITVWLDGERQIHLVTRGRRLTAGRSLPVKPFGVASYETSVAVRNIRVRRLK